MEVDEPVLESALAQMEVGVDEPGDDQPAVEVDALRAGPLGSRDLLATIGDDDLAVLDEQGLDEVATREDRATDERSGVAHAVSRRPGMLVVDSRQLGVRAGGRGEG